MEKFIEIRPKILFNKIKHRISISHALKITGVIKLVHAVTTQPDLIKSIMPSRRKLLSKTKKFRRNAKTDIESDIPWFSFIFIDFSLDFLCKNVILLIFHSKSDFFVFESNFLRDGIIFFIKSGCVVTAWTSFIIPVIFWAWEFEIRCLILGIGETGRISYDFYINWAEFRAFTLQYK